MKSLNSGFFRINSCATALVVSFTSQWSGNSTSSKAILCPVDATGRRYRQLYSYRPGPSAKKEVVHVSSVASRFELARVETHASEWGEWFLADDFRRRFIISSSLNQQVLHQAENVLQLFNSGIVLTRFACSRDLNWSQIQSILCFRFVSDWRLFPIIAYIVSVRHSIIPGAHRFSSKNAKQIISPFWELQG